MAFKFVNPGYPALFDSMDSGSLIGGVNSTYNPENGVYIDVCSADGYVTIPNLAHIYISFGVFGLDMRNQRELFNLYAGNTRIARIRFFGSGHGIDLLGNDGTTLNYVVLNNNNYYKCLFDVELTGSKCNIALFIDGTKKASGTYDCSETAITKVKICNGNVNDNIDYGMISNIIIADVDCSNERVAICDLTTNNDVINVDADALVAKMAEYVDNAAITSLQVGASNIEVASSDITSVKETLNSTDIEIKSISARKGVIFNNMAVNPLTGGNWTIQALKDIRFKLTGVKA